MDRDRIVRHGGDRGRHAPAPRIALAGYMGAGKSTIGRRIAEKLDVPFLDLDDRLTRKFGSIPDIFAREGEGAFRAYESVEIGQIVAETTGGGVIALGGGAVLERRNLDAFRNSGWRLVFLRAPLWLLWNRVAPGAVIRPLALGGREEFVQRYRRRLPTYRSLDTIVDAYPGSPEEVADRVCAAIPGGRRGD